MFGGEVFYDADGFDVYLDIQADEADDVFGVVFAVGVGFAAAAWLAGAG